LELITTTAFRSKVALCSCAGAPIGMPSCFASSLRAITQPSLLLKITSGRPIRRGLKTRSHDA